MGSPPIIGNNGMTARERGGAPIAPNPHHGIAPHDGEQRRGDKVGHE
eukprot:CAMPEP_0171306454 /NCGR_PEP_ID=MMETSP0816-20121228/16467_1 /TAXON_ID=420281 /ORGANISM="Proboscia inermis, Strain CCAP1064/1" /LENGTH=46 /DNA_ID= /DNA_START= /DNA_END= /DNA_ORIENTATION=